MKSGRIGTSRQCVRTASSVPLARSFSMKVRRSSSMTRMNERRGRAGKSSMISSRVIAFISSSVYPRYVNSFLRRVSTSPARFRNFRRAAFARPPIFFAMSGPPSFRLQPFRLRRHPAHLATGRSIIAHRRRLSDVLMGTAAVGMVDRVHRDPADVEHRLAEGTVREPLLPRLREGLVAAARAGDRADRGATLPVERVELTGRELHDRTLTMAHHDRLGAGGADEPTSVSGPRLDVVHEGSLRDVLQGQRVPAVDVRGAVCDPLSNGKPVARDHEDLLSTEPHAGEGRRVAGRLKDVRHHAGTGEAGMRDQSGMSMARRSVRRGRAAAAALGAQVLSHQNTPIRMPISSAENSGLSLMIACLPSFRTNVLTFATFTWNRSSNAFLTSARVDSRRTRNSRRFPSFRFCAGVPCSMLSDFSVT